MSQLAALGARIRLWPAAMQAAFWMLIIGTLVTVTLVFVRRVTPEIHVFEVVFFRSVFAVAFMSPWLIRRGAQAMRITRPGLITLRSSLAFFGSACLFWAATLMPLADVTAITFSRPILAAVAAVLFLGEVVRMRRWTAILLGVAGAAIIVRPGFADLNIGVLFAFGSVVTLTWNTINLKLLTRTETPDAIAVWHAAIMIPLGFAASLFVWTTPTWEQLFWMLLIGVFEMLTQRAMSRGYAAADTTVVVAFSFLRLPVAALLGFALFGEVPEIWVWVGAGVIAASSVYIAHRESSVGRLRRAEASAREQGRGA